MTIRPATVDDADAITCLVRPLIDRFITDSFPDEGRSALLAYSAAELIAQGMRENVRYHVAEDTGKLIGSVGIRDDRHLFHLFVAETHHRQGIGRALWETAKAAAEPGNAGAGFTVNSSRFAIPFYRTLGFVETGPPEERQGIVSVPMRYKGGAS